MTQRSMVDSIKKPAFTQVLVYFTDYKTLSYPKRNYVQKFLF